MTEVQAKEYLKKLGISSPKIKLNEKVDRWCPRQQKVMSLTLVRYTDGETYLFKDIITKLKQKDLVLTEVSILVFTGI